MCNYEESHRTLPTQISPTYTQKEIHLQETCNKKVQPIAFGVSLNLHLQSQSPWSLFNGTWYKRPREQDYRLRFEIEEMTLQMQWAVLHANCTTAPPNTGQEMQNRKLRK